MIFRPTGLDGAYIVEPERLGDQRGFLARTWCAETFAAHGLNGGLSQCSIVFSYHKGTLRGMHYQAAPHAEAKLVRCTMGATFNVLIDLRPESPTFKQHFGLTLSAQNRLQLYIPEGFAQGNQTLEDNTEIFYQMTTSYAPQAARGVRWDDPVFGIEWPDGERIIIERDRNYPDFTG